MNQETKEAIEKIKIVIDMIRCPHKEDVDNCGFCKRTSLLNQALAILRTEPKCKTCGGSGFDPNRSTNKEQYVPDVPCPDCTAPEPTSLGNTLRSIADNSIKSETDKNIIYQAARRLDRWWAYIQELEAQLKTKDELLFAYESVRAPKQPPAGEFTKRFRILLATQDKTAVVQDGYEACDRLDRSEASRENLRDNLKMLVALLCHPGSFVSVEDIEKAKAAINQSKEISEKK